MMMKIVLDTNIFRQDLLMNSTHFNLLFDYSEKTKSLIVVPEVVFEEVIELYKRELQDKIARLKAIQKNMRNLLVNGTIEENKVVIEEEAKKYTEHFLKKLNIKETVMYKDSYLKELVRRATQRVKPCSENGEEFRDALLWLTVLDIARVDEAFEVVFISNDNRAFAEKNSGLHSDLQRELDREKLVVRYYDSIQAFIKAHGTRIEFITKTWIEENLVESDIDRAVTDILEKHGEEKLIRWLELSKRSTGYYNVIQPLIGLDKFYVYEMNDGSFYVEATYFGEVEVEFEYEGDGEDSDDYYARSGYEYKIDPLSGDMTMEPVLRSKKETKSETDCFSPEIEVTIGINISKDKKITSFHILEWDLP